MIGLSGLITPSLDEMVHVAREMEREGFDDAAADRRRDDQRQAHGRQDRAELSRAGRPRQGRLAVRRRRRPPEPPRAARRARPREPRRRRSRSATASPSAAQRKLVPYAEAVAPPVRDRLGRRRRSPARRSSAPRCCDDFPLAELVPYIDWSPFFMTWELKGKYPAIFDDPVVGAEAPRAVRRRPRRCSTGSSREQLLTANGVYGFFPANTDGDDIVVYTDESRTAERLRFPMLRQQWEREGQTTFRSLADYIAPVDSGVADYLGAFAVTAGLRASTSWSHEFEADHDDYNAIMAKALADRLAEAFAECCTSRPAATGATAATSSSRRTT